MSTLKLLKPNSEPLLTRYATSLIAALTLTLIAGCGSLGVKDENAEDERLNSEQKLYDAAQKSIRSGNYTVGIERLEAIETHFPFGQFAEQAHLELIYANYMKGAYEEATVAAERFIELHPTHPHVDYAYYMRGLSSFERNRGFFDRFLGSPEATRDISNAKKAFGEFNELLQQFPGSLYAKDAKKRMVHLRNIIAEHELIIAKFYLSSNTWVAAANRASGIVENFPTTIVVPEALAILVEANYKLGLTEPANNALRVLALNFPSYESFDENGTLVLNEQLKNRDRSLANVLTFGLLDRPAKPPTLMVDIRDRPELAKADTEPPQS